MKNLFNLCKLSAVCGVFLLLLTLSACTKSGLNVDALPLLPNQVINYGARVLADQIAPEAKVYGQLQKGTSQQRQGQVLNNEVKAVNNCIAGFRKLPDVYSFTVANEKAYNDWIEKNLQKNFQTLSPVIQEASKNRSSATNLATEMTKEVKTGGTLQLRFKDAKKLVEDVAHPEFDRLADMCTKAYEEIYQIGILMPTAMAQKEALDNLGKVQTSLRKLINNAENVQMFTTADDRREALKETQVALADAEHLRVLIDLMSGKTPVKDALTDSINTLGTKLGYLTPNYVEKITDVTQKNEAEGLLIAANSAQKELSKLAADLGTIESFKGSDTDPILNALKTKALSSNKSVLLSTVSIDKDTEIDQLGNYLNTNPVVIIKKDASSKLLIDSFASWIVHGGGSKALPDTGPDNVIGPENSGIIKAKADYGMGAEDFREYATSIAEKIRQTYSKGKNVWVIDDAEALAAEGADINAMIDKFVADNGKVIVVTSNPTLYPRGALFASRDLSISEAVLVATAVAGKFNLKVPPEEVGERVVKVLAASSEEIRLANVSSLTREAAVSVSELPSPTSSQLDRKVMSVMAANKVPTIYAEVSNVMHTPLKQVEQNRESNPSYYVRQSLGSTSTDVEQQMKAIADRRELDKKDAERTQLDQARRSADAKDRLMASAVAKVKEASVKKHEAAQRAMTNISSGIRAKADEVNRAFADILQTSNKCTVKKPNDFASINAMFTSETRQSFLAAEYFKAIDTLNPAERATVEGKPNLNDMKSVSNLSCLIFGETNREKLASVLREYEFTVSRSLLDLEKTSSCYNRNDADTCFSDAARNFETLRSSLAQNDVEDSFLKKALANNTVIPIFYDQPTNLDIQSEFWLSKIAPNRISLVAAPFLNNLGGFIHENQLNESKRFAHENLNRQYYISTILKIIGTSNGLADINGSKISLPEMQRDDLKFDISQVFGQMFFFVKTLLKDFKDNETIMVKAHRVVNDNYPDVVADKLAGIASQLATNIYEQVIKPFWSMPGSDLKFFQEEGAGSPEARRQVWANFSNLTPLIEDLAQKSGGKLVDPGNGNIAKGHDDLVAFMGALIEVRDKLFILSDSLVAGPDQALEGLEASLRSKINNSIKIPLDSIIQKTDLGAVWNDAGPTAKPVIPAVANIAKELMKWFEIAYDLHKFNYFNMQNKPEIGDANARKYPAWHSKYDNINPKKPIKHPLEL